MHNVRGWLIGILGLVVVVGGIGFAAGAQRPVPLRLLANYPLPVLSEEMNTMNDCAECHDTAEFHTCATCHDDHGAIEMENVPFYAVVSVTGDVPEPGYVLVDDVLPLSLIHISEPTRPY